MKDQDQTVSASFDTDVLRKVNSPATRIDIFYQGREMSFDKVDLPLKLGRDETSCQIVVKSDVASRVHASIEVQDNKIGIRDNSTNGTFIRIGRNESFVIRDSFYPLVGQGEVQLGKQFDADNRDVIYYRMVSAS